MRFQIARFICLGTLLFSLAAPLFAQDTPTVTITPESGEVEKAVFTIEIDGLQADTSYKVEIVFEGAVVFSSEETSDQAGHIPYPVSSTEGDAPGTYTLRVVSDGEIIASADFVLTEADESEAEEERDFLGDLTVAPETAPFGKVQKITIAELERQTKYTVEITASETFQSGLSSTAHQRRRLVSSRSRFSPMKATPHGHHSIAVYDEEGELIAEGEFTNAKRHRNAMYPCKSTRRRSQRAEPLKSPSAGLRLSTASPPRSLQATSVMIDTVLARASSDGECDPVLRHA